MMRGAAAGHSRPPSKASAALPDVLCRTRWIFPVVLSVLIVFVQTPTGNAAQRSYGEIGYFWHIDSLHFDSNFTIEGNTNDFCWRPTSGGRHSTSGSGFPAPSSASSSSSHSIGQFGSYLCDSPPALVDSVMKFMRMKTGDDADFILWTGNTVPQSPSFPPSQRLRLISDVSELFRLNFPYTTVYPALGNLDLLENRERRARMEHGGVARISSVTSKRKQRRRDRRRRRRRKEKEIGGGTVSEVRHGNTTSSTQGTSPRPPRPRSEASKVMEELCHIWDTWLPPKAVDSFRRGGYYTIELHNRRLRLVALNTNLYLDDVDPDGELHDVDIEASWLWLERTMIEARRKGQNVIIFGHSPPGKFERDYSSTGHHWLDHASNRRFVHLVRTFSDVIVGQFFGHQHTDSFRLFKDVAGQTISWAFLNPSVSPYKRSVQVGQESFSTNPAIRLYRYDTNTGEIFDYAQYYLNLHSTNARDKTKSVANFDSASHAMEAKDEAPVEAQWRLEYNFTTHYRFRRRRTPEHLGRGIITSSVLESLERKLANNRTWFDSYFRANAANLPAGRACGDRCRQVQTCAIANVDYDDFRMCVTTAKALSANDGVATAAGRQVASAATGLAVLLAAAVSSV